MAVGVGAFVPDRILTSAELGDSLGVSEEWILQRTGIRERRIAPPEMATSDLAVAAAKLALNNAGLAAQEVDLIIFATSTPDMLMPATACQVQFTLGAHKAAALDISAACAGFSYGVAVASQFLATGFYRNVLVIGADVMSRFLNWQDASSCILFGDGAGAIVLQASMDSETVFHSVLFADGSGYELLTIPSSGSLLPRVGHQNNVPNKAYLTMDGSAVYRFGLEVIEKGVRQILHDTKLSLSDIGLVIFHQANRRLLESVCKRLNIPEHKVIINVDRYGNTSAASIPIALWDANARGRLRKGELVILIGFGAGMLCAANLIRWAGSNS